MAKAIESRPWNQQKEERHVTCDLRVPQGLTSKSQPLSCTPWRSKSLMHSHLGLSFKPQQPVVLLCSTCLVFTVGLKNEADWLTLFLYSLWTFEIISTMPSGQIKILLVAFKTFYSRQNFKKNNLLFSWVGKLAQQVKVFAIKSDALNSIARATYMSLFMHIHIENKFKNFL